MKHFNLVMLLILIMLPSGTTAQWMTATLPDGRSQISSVTVGDNIYFVGGETSGTQRYFKMNIYNVPTDTWTTIDLPNGTIGPRTIAADNKIYFGDIEGDRTIYIYSIEDGSWKELDVPGFIGTLTYMDRMLIVEDRGDLMLYNIDTETWTEYDFPQQSATVTATNGKIALAGSNPNLVRIYDVASDTWSESTLSIERFDIRSVSYQRKMFFIGGDTTGVLGSVSRIDIYDTESDTWSIDSMSRARSRFDVTIHDGKLVIAGGQIFSFFEQFRKEVDILDLQTNTWETYQMPTARSYPSVIGYDDKIYIAGGDADEDNLDIIEILTLEATNTLELPFQKISLYPNPAFDNLTLESDYTIYSMEIFDIQGRCVYLADHLFGHKHELDLTSLGPGIYNININHRQQQLTFLKQ
ncbi:MAG: T9SS type A sorting domain-containing protein [Saprospiraceae bacterium]|nr:T9SS type A sorting domain-containing protein [Candidatus Opimibacter skivensis]